MGRLTLATALCVAAGASAQGIAPDIHWGANGFPETDPEVRVGLSLNRFTEFSKSGGRYNDIQQTMGFNNVNVSIVDQLPSYPDWMFNVWAGGGRTGDQPSRFLQNEFLHNTWGLDRVPVGRSRNAWDYMGGGSLTYSREGEPFADDDIRGRIFGGFGAALGTIYNEPFVHVGAEIHLHDWNMKVGIMDRFSLPREGDAFSEVADQSNVAQLYIGYVPSRLGSSAEWFDWLGAPEFGFTFTHDSGLFVESVTNDPIDTWFISMMVKWPTGLKFELWNDILNSTDFGPTVGMVFSVDVMTLWEQRWF